MYAPTGNEPGAESQSVEWVDLSASAQGGPSGTNLQRDSETRVKLKHQARITERKGRLEIDIGRAILDNWTAEVKKKKKKASDKLGAGHWTLEG